MTTDSINKYMHAVIKMPGSGPIRLSLVGPQEKSGRVVMVIVCMYITMPGSGPIRLSLVGPQEKSWRVVMVIVQRCV